MGELNAIGQKIKGKAQKVKGDIEMNSDNLGDKVKGGISKIKGSVNDTMADAKLHRSKK